MITTVEHALIDIVRAQSHDLLNHLKEVVGAGEANENDQLMIARGARELRSQSPLLNALRNCQTLCAEGYITSSNELRRKVSDWQGGYLNLFRRVRVPADWTIYKQQQDSAGENASPEA